MNRRKKHGARSRRVRLIALLLGVPVLLLAAYTAASQLEKSHRQPETQGDYRQRYQYDKQVEFGGESYRQRKDISTLLFMGVDRRDNAEANGFRNGGQADFLRLVVIDSGEKRISQVQIDRDTMTPITVLGVLGNRSGVRTAQISLSHGFGDGREQSCELTVEAVSNLFFNLPIDHYVAMNMDGISTLNDLLGGITVTLEDDFSAIDPAMTPGTTLTLMGDQAETFVRSRMSVGVGTNEARMARQELYMEELAKALDAKLAQDQNFVGTLYDGLEENLITNMSRGSIVNEAAKLRQYTRDALIRPAGSYEIGADGFMQFHVDEEALMNVVLDLFYQRVD